MLWFSMTGSPFCGSDSRCSRQLFNPRLKPGPVTPFCLVSVRYRIVDGEFVYERVRGCARESLDNTGFLVDPSDRTKRRPPKLQSSLIIKIGCFDDKHVAFPMTARIAQVLADRLRQMRAAVERNEPCVMDHFRQNQH